MVTSVSTRPISGSQPTSKARLSCVDICKCFLRRVASWICSDRGQSQSHACSSVLPTSNSPPGVWGRASGHRHSDEAVLGWRPERTTDVQRRRQSTQDYQPWKVRIPAAADSSDEKPVALHFDMKLFRRRNLQFRYSQIAVRLYCR